MGEPATDGGRWAVRVLVADDEDDMRLLVAQQLRLGGPVDVVGEASDGEEALVRFRELEPDVVVLDQRMPGRSGIEVAELMRHEDPDVRIVLYTAYADAAVQEEAERLDVALVQKGQVPALVAAVTGGTPG